MTLIEADGTGDDLFRCIMTGNEWSDLYAENDATGT